MAPRLYDHDRIAASIKFHRGHHAYDVERVLERQHLRLAVQDRHQIVRRTGLLPLVGLSAFLCQLLELGERALGSAAASVLDGRESIAVEMGAYLEGSHHQVDAEGAAGPAHEVGDTGALAHLVSQ